MFTISVIITFALCLALGIPVAFSLACLGLILSFFLAGLPLKAFLVLMAQRMFVGSEQFVLLAIPLFIFAGELMSKGGVTIRIIEFASGLVGRLRGGLAMVTVIASAFFAGISGSAAADTAAIGSMMIPAMKSRGYDKNFACALQASAGTLGPIIPPSVLMVIYGMIANVSVAQLFLGGVLPGIIIALLLLCYSYYVAYKKSYPRESSIGIKELLRSTKRALLPLGMPAIIMGGILGGIFTPTEAAGVACIYGYCVSRFVYKRMTFKELINNAFNASLDTSKVMFILAISNFVAFLLSRQHIPEQAASFMLSLSSNKYIVLLLINFLLLLVGCFLEAATALIILTPILLGISTPLMINPIHLGVLVVVNLCIGTITPPVGLSLYIAMAIGDTTLEKISRACFPFVVVMIIGLFIITYIPFTVLALPNLFK
jgi:C4-dicarboxylate transporter, DctM subunit